MLYGNCMECKHFYVCYYKAVGSEPVMPAVKKYFDSIQKRDLCVNNDKVDWERKP